MLLRFQLSTYKKLSGCTCLSVPEMELGGSNDCHGKNIIKYGNTKIDWLCGWTLPKIPIICKKVSNKSCWDFNFLQKTQWAHISTSVRCLATELKRLLCSKYYNIWRKWENRSTLWLNAAEIHNFCSKIIKNNLLIQYPRNDSRICWYQCGPRTFIWNFVAYEYFWQPSALKSIHFPISVHYISNMAIFRAPSPLQGEIDMCAYLVFCRKLKSQQLLFETFLHNNQYFWKHSAAKSNLFFHFCTL